MRRFVDSNAGFLFVAPSEVAAVAKRFAAEPLDAEGARYADSGGDEGQRCSFDAMLGGFGLTGGDPAIGAPLVRLATLGRGADAGRLDAAPECAGLLAACLGLSRMFEADLEQIEAGTTLFDALFRWARDAAEETHAH